MFLGLIKTAPVGAAPVDSRKTQILIRAKQLVKRGWRKHAFYSGVWIFKRYCVVGAIDEAEKELHSDGPWREIVNIFQFANSIQNTSVAKCNDSYFRTKSEVLAAFDKAIEYSRKEAC